MSGLGDEQLDELELMVAELLDKPWEKGTGRPRELSLREALIVACGYSRNNITEEIWAEIFDVDQSTISRYITFLTPLVDVATEEFRPSAEDSAEATRSAIALVDGTLWPCWSWDGESKLWSGKYKTTGQRLPDRHESSGPRNIRFGSCYRQPARHGETQGIRCRDDPEAGRRSVGRQGIHWD